MTDNQAQYIIDTLLEQGFSIESGLTLSEIESIEKIFSFNFPPDLRFLLTKALPVSSKFIDWRLGITNTKVFASIMNNMDWPLEGILFDIESNNFWLSAWGTMPTNLPERIKIAKELHRKYPKLIPIFSHRYISETPSIEGNPVFSVYQTDIIYYGDNLANYFEREFKFTLPDSIKSPTSELREIPFWSGLCEDGN